MKKFISIFLSFCILFSLCSFSYADNIANLEIDSSAIYSLGQLNIRNNLNVDLVNLQEFLPIINHSGIPFNSSDTQRIRFNKLTITSDSNFNGYYSVYLILDWYNDSSSITFSAGDVVTWFLTIGLVGSGSAVYPQVEVGINSEHSDYTGYFYHFTTYCKWDLHITNSSNITLSSNSSSQFLGSGTTNQANWMIVPQNFSLIKYTSSSDSYFDSLSNILSAINSINSSLTSYLPQIVEYLDSIDSNLEEMTHDVDTIRVFTTNINTRVGYIRDYVQALNTFLQSILGTNTGDSTNPTLWFLIKGIYDNIVWPFNGTDTFGGRLFKYGFTVYNRLTGTITDGFNLSESYTPSNYNAGYLGNFRFILQSINNFLAQEYLDKSAITSSTAYHSGQSLQNDINSAGGYGSLTGVVSGFSGFGNVSLIGSLFNGISSAFRWFSSTTQNDIDNVQRSRGVQDPIVDYYSANQDLIFEYLSPAVTLDDQPDN